MQAVFPRLLVKLRRVQLLSAVSQALYLAA
jgi:hypothetical protein